MTSPEPNGIVHVGSVLADVLKEVRRRCELRARLEAERGRPIDDVQFLAIAESSGLRI